MSKKFYLVSFGCRTNQADSAAIRDDFLSGQYEETDQCTIADAIVVNSCTVTHRSDQQVRQLIRKLRRGNADARIIVTGCYAQRDPQALAQISGVDAVVGNTQKTDIFKIAHEALQSKTSLPNRREIAAVYRDDFRKTRTIPPGPVVPLEGKTRPFVKIQDGCDAKCTYCIIPVVRGPSRSAPPEGVLKQVLDLVSRGFREVVLTGIHIGTYGMYLQPRYPLDRLMANIIKIQGLERVRLSSIEPMELSDRIIDLARQSEKICQHFHICLQTGSDRVLKMMHRPYNSARFGRIVERIRDRLPDAGIGTDVIVGFPGETEEDHHRTVEFIEQMPFTYLHVFPYSDRRGTAASDMVDKVSPQTKKRRSSQLRRISEEKNRAFRRSYLGRKLSVLTLNEETAGKRTALSGNYLHAKVDVSIPANRILEGVAVKEDGDCLVLSVA